MDIDNTRVHIDHGGADTDEFWDVSLDPEQLSYAQVDGDERTGFSISLDLTTGEIELNAGYEPGSRPDKDEWSMFAEFRDSAVEALFEHVENRDGFDAFIAMAKAEATDRHDRLVTLSIRLDEHETADEEELV